MEQKCGRGWPGVAEARVASPLLSLLPCPLQGDFIGRTTLLQLTEMGGLVKFQSSCPLDGLGPLPPVQSPQECGLQDSATWNQPTTSWVGGGGRLSVFIPLSGWGSLLEWGDGGSSCTSQDGRARLHVLLSSRCHN